MPDTIQDINAVAALRDMDIEPELRSALIMTREFCDSKFIRQRIDEIPGAFLKDGKVGLHKHVLTLVVMLSYWAGRESKEIKEILKKY